MPRKFTPNPFRIFKDTAIVGLTDKSGFVVSEFLVDICDLDLVLTYGRWSRVIDRRTGRYYVQNVTTRGTVLLHRLLTDAPKSLVVDHKNHDGLNNRRSNLRVCEIGHNNQNREGANRNGSSGYRNVYWVPKINKWLVRFRIGGRDVSGGYFESLDMAIVAVAEGRKVLFPYATN